MDSISIENENAGIAGHINLGFDEMVEVTPQYPRGLAGNVGSCHIPCFTFHSLHNGARMTDTLCLRDRCSCREGVRLT